MLNRSLQSRKYFVYYILVMSLVIFMPVRSLAQSRPVAQEKRMPMRPNTVSVIGVLSKVDSSSAKLKIIQVVAQGSGIVNTLSAGDEIIVKLTNDAKKLVGVKIEGYLKEELGSDASKSHYTLVDASVKLK